VFIASSRTISGNDKLVAITEDIICRDINTRNINEKGQVASFREGVNLINNNINNNDNNNNNNKYVGNLYDIKECVDSVHALEPSKMLSLFYTSKTPNDISNTSHHISSTDGTNTVRSLLGNGLTVSESPLSLSPAISPSNMTPGIGINKKNVQNVISLNGICFHYVLLYLYLFI
jgi:hypothetical protein